MILQDPKHALNPVMRWAPRSRNPLRDHRGLRGRAARERGLELLADVRIRDPRRVARAWPHELGRHRAAGDDRDHARGRARPPDRRRADLGARRHGAAQVLAILDDLVAKRGMGLVFISHDLELVATLCDRVVIMYAGRVVETCAAKELHAARHPYTRGLLGCLPRLDRPQERLSVLLRDAAWLEDGRR